MSVLEIVKRVRLRASFFKVNESVDRLDFLELENKSLKRNIKEINEERCR